MYVVDASIWVSRFVPADAHHVASRAWLTGAVEAGSLLVAPALLLPELAAAIARRTGRADLASRAVELLARVSVARLVAVDREVAQEAARLAAGLRLRGADAVYVAVAAGLGMPLITWDREQLERASSRVRALTPADAPAS